MTVPVSASSIPGALAALLELGAAALPVEVQTAQGTVLSPEQVLLIVGYDDGGEPAVSGSRAGADYSDTRAQEEYDVQCLLSVWSGDSGVAATSAQLFGYLDLLDAALLAGRGPDGALRTAGIARAVVTDFQLRHPITGQGETASLQFLIHVTAWRRS